MNSIDVTKIEWIKANIKAGMTVVDIGACVGLFTEILSVLVSESGRVIAFEPKKANFNRLSETMRGRNNTILEHAGIADYTTDNAILYCQGPNGWNSFYSNAPYLDQYAHQEHITLHRLDDYLLQKNVTKVDLIKLDVEGYDLQVLQSAQKILSNSSKVALIMEIHYYKNTKEELFSFFVANDFVVYGVGSTNKITDFKSLPNEVIALKGY